MPKYTLYKIFLLDNGDSSKFEAICSALNRQNAKISKMKKIMTSTEFFWRACLSIQITVNHIFEIIFGRTMSRGFQWLS